MKKNYLPVIIGLAAAGAAAFLFRKEIKKIFTKKEENNEEPPLTATSPEIQNFVPQPLPAPVVVSSPSVTPTIDINKGVVPAAKKTLSSLGTSKDKLLMGENLELGDQGQEVVKLQQILNRFAEINRTSPIKEDGNFGVGTQAKLKAILGKTSTTLREMYLALFAYWNARKVGKTKDWYKYFFIPYLTDNNRLNVARANYFKNNPVI